MGLFKYIKKMLIVDTWIDRQEAEAASHDALDQPRWNMPADAVSHTWSIPYLIKTCYVTQPHLKDRTFIYKKKS
jgi:hypothetical protein